MTNEKAGHLKKYRFKPGQSGNPKGRKKDPPELKKFKNLTHEQLVEVGSIILAGNMDQLKEIYQNPASTPLQVMIAAVATRVIKRGDMAIFDVLLNRLIGKVSEDINVSGIPAANSPQVIVTLPSNGRERVEDE